MRTCFLDPNLAFAKVEKPVSCTTWHEKAELGKLQLAQLRRVENVLNLAVQLSQVAKFVYQPRVKCF